MAKKRLNITSKGDPARLTVLGMSIALGVGIVILLNIIPLKFGRDLDFSRMLIDWTNCNGKDGDSKKNWLSVQAFMWIAFCIGFGDLWVRSYWAKKESAQFGKDYLPEDETTILTDSQLTPIYQQVSKADQRLFLPKLIRRTIIQFRKSNSVEQANSLLNSNLELCLHELDLRYNLMRYIIWVIPTLGFIGTVLGIANALNYAGTPDLQAQQLLEETTSRLGVAFYTTLVSLIMSGILVLVMNFVQGAEEKALNQSGQYTMDNLINRLLEKKNT